MHPSPTLTPSCAYPIDAPNTPVGIMSAQTTIERMAIAGYARQHAPVHVGEMHSRRATYLRDFDRAMRRRRIEDLRINLGV
jgi:hypothetical protein